MFKNFKVTILSLVLFSLLLFASCGSSNKNLPTETVAGISGTEADNIPDMPKESLSRVIPRITTSVAPKYFDVPETREFKYIGKNDENVRIDSFSRREYPQSDDTHFYCFSSWWQPGDNGVELMDNFYKWMDEEKRKIHAQEDEGLLPAGGANPIEEWMSDFITYPEDDFDTTEYKEKVLKAVAKIYDTQFPGDAPADLTLNQTSRIQASFEFKEEDLELDCRVLEFDAERTESGYKQIYYFVDTSGEEEKELWYFVNCLKAEDKQTSPKETER